MRRAAPAVLAALLLAACGAEPAERSAQRPSRTVATNLDVPWGIAFLPGGDALVAQRDRGTIVRISRRTGRKRVVMRLDVSTGTDSEGGLLGLAVSPSYRRDRFVYAYYTTASENRIVRFRLGGRVRPLFTGIPRGQHHNGGRLVFGPDGKLYAGTGDAGDRSRAQRLDSEGGKILRLNPDGSVPRDNPFRGSLVWSLGHRNVQGLAFDRAGRLWATEFGQNRVDEVNLIRRGRNYGWPAVEGRGDTQGGRFTNPKRTWSTGEASPSGAAIRGSSLYVAALRGEALWRVPLRGTRTLRPRRLLHGRYGRLRTVVVAPDGSLWVATSNRDGRGSPRRGDDRIVRLR
ncbi:MAG TPA: PQQ-dependent sugar dehydrogenase [Solirubrobacteraceae bacterium]|jgi:glucose/arabinose dehydrogenase|nr:PQQ-dependent sugar dehydrogenase [Solirubrobacteraceae bacterium]